MRRLMEHLMDGGNREAAAAVEYLFEVQSVANRRARQVRIAAQLDAEFPGGINPELYGMVRAATAEELDRVAALYRNR